MEYIPTYPHTHIPNLSTWEEVLESQSYISRKRRWSRAEKNFNVLIFISLLSNRRWNWESKWNIHAREKKNYRKVLRKRNESGTVPPYILGSEREPLKVKQNRTGKNKNMEI